VLPLPPCQTKERETFFSKKHKPYNHNFVGLNFDCAALAIIFVCLESFVLLCNKPATRASNSQLKANF